MKMATPQTTQANQITLTSNRQLMIKFIMLLGCYFTLHIVLRVFLSDSLDYDEAEQALLGQWLLPGYTEQPPLYTWIQHGLFRLLGENVLAVSLLKNSLLFFTYVFVFLSGKAILEDTRLAILAACSLLFIPQIGWESQRDMTHTTLVVCAAAASFWQSLRLVKNQNFVNYCIFGLLLSIGILGKANFALFIATLLLTMLTFSEGIKTILSPRFLMSILVVALLTGPYFLWMYNNQDIVFSVTHKFKFALENYQMQGIISLLSKVFLFLTPMWLIFLLIFPAGFVRNQNPQADFHHQYIKRYLLILFLLLLIVVLVFKVTYVKDRWLQPLLFVVPLFFFSRLDPSLISLKRFKIFLSVIAFTATAVYIAFTIRVAGASYIDRFTRLNYPFTAIADDLRQSGFSNGLIMSNNRFLAGNMRIQFPESTALIPGYKFGSRTAAHNFTAAAVLWEADLFPAMPPELESFLKKTYNVVPTAYPVTYFEHQYKYGRTETIKFAVVQFPLPDSPKN
ncbi:MAG: glycosyltransferase family 39 protein [Desulforhopalus sp.]